MPLKNGKELKEEKKRKFQAKHEARQRPRNDHGTLAWIQEHSSRVTLVHASILTDENNQCITPLLEPYRNIKEHSSDETIFVAEGTETVRLLLQQTQHFHVQSIFVKEHLFFQDPVHLQQDLLQAWKQQPDIQVILSEDEATMARVAGYQSSRGCMACAKPSPTTLSQYQDEQWLFNFLQQQQKKNSKTLRGLRILALDGVSDTANLGGMVRCASAFGMDVILLSPTCCSPWYRRSIRVSMGHVFRVPLVRVHDLAHTLQRLAHQLDVTSYAAVVNPSVDLVLEQMGPSSMRSSSWCCCMGSEGTGISQSVREACRYTLRIGMEEGVDSLNVVVATGILLHGLKEREG